MSQYFSETHLPWILIGDFNDVHGVQFNLAPRCFTCQNHRPILLDTSPFENKSPPIFHFEHMWVTNVDCVNVIRKAWKETVLNSPAQTWITNLARCRVNLKDWSKPTFPQFQSNTTHLLRQLDDLCISPDTATQSPSVGTQIASTIAAIDENWRLEEYYWHQRSRVNWLQVGDQNTSFFHQTTIQRRQFNKILRLKNDCNHWLDNELDITSHLNSYLVDLFTATPINSLNAVLAFVDPVVTAEMNNELLPVTIDEIKDAVFDLGVLVNGKPGVLFKPTRGLRQGDPLSPFLFLFVNDVLSQIICKLSMVNILQPVQIEDLGPKITSLDAWIQQLINLWSSVVDMKFVSTHISFLLWNIWKHRCGSIFNYFSLDPVLVSKLASQQADEFLSVQNRHHRKNSHSVLVPSASALLGDSTGSLLHGVVYVGQAISAEAAETQALLQGLKLAKSQIKCLAGSFSSINWSWISREANAAADTVAHFASSLECSLNWVHNPPSFLLYVLQSYAVSAPP
ncbi:hypothetical protein ACLB2K_007186 [Fragaria x ananassa]